MDDLNTTLTKQSQELMTAKTLDSDLEFAYRLQMQEAINASLALHNTAAASSSRTPSHPHPRPHPHPQPNDVVIPQSPDDDVLDCRSAHDRRHLLLRARARGPQAKRGRDEENEGGSRPSDPLSNNLRRILREWNEQGRYSHHRFPARPSSSSSSSSSKDLVERFRLYFKGLVSEEMVKGMMVNVSGAGVAICDSRDNLILESKKNLEALVNGVVVSSVVAELQALIEALNKALTLKLKSVTFFCDDYMLYQYVTGGVPPHQSKIVTLVNQVDLLQRKFTYCKASLVPRNDIKFAFKYARDAIVSQIIWAEETSKGNLKETCVICFEDTDVDKIISVDGCLHRYCFSCMKQHVEVKLLNDMVVKCPHANCKSEVSIDSCGKFLAPNLVEVMSQRIKESSISPTEKVYCPYPRCSALMSKSEVLQYTKNVYIDAEESGARKCMKCQNFFCIKCKAPWHLNMTCYDYKRSNPKAHQGDKKLKSLAKSNRWHQCLKCNHMVELAGGCNHITCRCGYEFCYTCGAEWKNKKATCSCKMWDERNIIYDNQRR